MPELGVWGYGELLQPILLKKLIINAKPLLTYIRTIQG